MVSFRKALLFLNCCIAVAGFHVSSASAAQAKVDICHYPPGNPDNVRNLTISENALDAHLAHGDSVGDCDLGGRAIGGIAGKGGDPSACTCPKKGVWTLINLDGYMECNVLGIKRKMKGKDPNDGAFWSLNDDCSAIFVEAYEKEREDMVMLRGRDCLYFGIAPGEEDGAEVIFDGAYQFESEEVVSGEFFMEMSARGMDCSGYRPFKAEFKEPYKEKDIPKLEKKMRKQLEAAYGVQEEHYELIDRYLEKTEGGKALGGLNGNE